MADLFASRPDPASPPAAPPMRGNVDRAPAGTVSLADPRAHRCFRCGVVTGLGKGLPHRGEAVRWACREHIGEL